MYLLELIVSTYLLCLSLCLCALYNQGMYHMSLLQFLSYSYYFPFGCKISRFGSGGSVIETMATSLGLRLSYTFPFLLTTTPNLIPFTFYILSTSSVQNYPSPKTFPIIIHPLPFFYYSLRLLIIIPPVFLHLSDLSELSITPQSWSMKPTVPMASSQNRSSSPPNLWARDIPIRLREYSIRHSKDDR